MRSGRSAALPNLCVRQSHDRDEELDSIHASAKAAAIVRASRENIGVPFVSRKGGQRVHAARAFARSRNVSGRYGDAQVYPPGNWVLPSGRLTWNPNVVLPPAATVPLCDALRAVTVCPLTVSVVFHDPVTV